METEVDKGNAASNESVVDVERVCWICVCEKKGKQQKEHLNTPAKPTLLL